MDLRKEMRYRLGAPALFSWQGGPSGCFQGEGLTRDISVKGAFIETATMPPPNSSIQVDLLLPSVPGMKGAVRITGRARVIRVEHQSPKKRAHGFAVATGDLNQWGLMAMQVESDVVALGHGGAN
jgi:hypothetical protein